MRVKGLKKILKNFGLLWQALKKFNDDNGFFLSSGIAFNILINFYNLFAEQLVEFLAGALKDISGALRDLTHKTFFNPDSFFCSLNGCNA